MPIVTPVQTKQRSTSCILSRPQGVRQSLWPAMTPLQTKLIDELKKTAIFILTHCTTGIAHERQEEVKALCCGQDVTWYP